MTLQLQTFETGPLGNKVCLLFDEATKNSVLVDPSFEPEGVIDFIVKKELHVARVLITHGHFDHFAGLSSLCSKLKIFPQIGLHPADLDLWRDGGGGKNYGFMIEQPADPDLWFEEGQVINLENREIEVRSAPGHSPGSVIFYVPSIKTAICGDVIFYHGVGRTDLPGGSHATLIESIRTQVLSLPLNTRLIPGHGGETTVQEEKDKNPYLDFSRSNRRESP
ncbi:MAG: MBL fold metallo-hydrolase [Chloroflexi bacterium]|nr:MBL fold metallo-hydrolase [Chloroflexota bacterium]